MNDQKTSVIDRVATSVEEVTQFEPGLGAYAFDNLGQAVRFADLMSKSGELIPPFLRDRPAVCLGITMRAVHWGFDPFALAQEAYQAKEGGPIGYQAKVFVAALERAGITLNYEYSGDLKIIDKPALSSGGKEVAKRTATGSRTCTAWFVIDGQRLEYTTPALDAITIKNSPLWHNDPDQALSYYAGRGWTRRFKPSVIMGAYSADEVRDMAPMKDVTPKPSGLGMLAARRRGYPTTPEAPTETKPNHGADSVHWTANLDVTSAFPGSDAWEKGVAAFQDGQPRESCPYEDDAAAACEWLGGWDGAKGAAE